LAASTISHYQIIKKLGAGGMGEVYLAEDTKLRRKVALKLLSLDVIKNQDRLRRFEQEAFAASALSHPNILVIYEIGVEGDAHFIATEYVEGQTLRQRMASAEMSLHEVLENQDFFAMWKDADPDIDFLKTVAISFKRNVWS